MSKDKLLLVGSGLIGIGVLLFAYIVYAQAPVVTPIPDGADIGAIIGLLPFIVAAAKGGQWVVFAGLLIMCAVWAAKKYLLTKMPTDAIPLVAIVLAILTVAGPAMVAGQTVGDSMIAGGAVGLSAISVWELLKRMLKLFFKIELK